MLKISKASRPNILLLMTDQMRSDAMGCAGNPHIRTPALDRLAREGIRFSQGYTPVPVCIAARHSTLTGHRCAIHRRFSNNNPHPDPSVVTLPQILNLHGYHTHAIGKMHFMPARRHFGFHRMELMEELPDFRQDDEYLMYLKQQGYGHIREPHGIRNLLYTLPQVSLIPEVHHGSTWVADRTIQFLKENFNRPFFCFSSWIAPHPPFNAPAPYASMYNPIALPLPVGWNRDPETKPPLMRPYSRYIEFASEAILRRIKALYYGNISLVDKGINRILTELDELGLAENTVVIFCSDHGEMLGDQRRFQKGNPHGSASRIPFILRFPARLDAGQVSEELVSLLDIMPTVLDATQVKYPGTKPLSGASLLGRKGGGLANIRKRLVIEMGREASRWLALREGKWRYSYYFDSGWEELYDLESDASEMENLLLRTEHPSYTEYRRLSDDMKAFLTKWEREEGLPSSLDPAGHLANFKEIKKDYPGHGLRMNTQFPPWIERLPEKEKLVMKDAGEALIEAVSNETTFTLNDLKAWGMLDIWLRLGGSLKGTSYSYLDVALPEDYRDGS